MSESLLSSETINAIKEACQNKPEMSITIGLYSKGIEEYHLFKNEGNEVPYEQYRYEIGSITKTFTGYILGKAVIEGKVSLEDRIDQFISNLPSGKIYPTLRSLATHTSGYPGDTLEFEERFKKNIAENEYNKINYTEMIKTIKSIELEDKIYPAIYSNIGIGILGYCLSQIYHQPIDTLIEEYIADLGLDNTSIVNRKDIVNLLPGYEKGKELGNLIWSKESIVGAAGFLYSTAEDMLKYAQSQFNSNDEIAKLCHMKYAEFDHDPYLPIDIGLCWMLSPDLDFSFHSGGTRCFASVLCVDTKRKAAVVILSNSYIENIVTMCIMQTRHLNK
ncbi:MAG: beta-lactamase family protein [Candidatus Niameybacter stercoravium]|nr:beta-lactamase family protein [Candidatus Niameybacter stercoravium]